MDILNIMGPAIAAAAALWGASGSTRARVISAAGAALAVALLTPSSAWRAFWIRCRIQIEAYLRPIPGLSNFFLFPWSGFVFAGAAVGVLLDAARTSEQESRLNGSLAAAGAALAAGAYAASFLPTPYAQSEFWTSSPSYFLLRTGILTLLIPAAYAWQKFAIRQSWSPIQQLGRSSLFIYWIHVEMVYGLISLRIHKSLTHRQAWVAYGAFVVFMLLCALAKDRVVEWWDGRGPGTRRKTAGRKEDRSDATVSTSRASGEVRRACISRLLKVAYERGELHADEGERAAGGRRLVVVTSRSLRQRVDVQLTSQVADRRGALGR